jgi:protoporphyrinogen oxidase
VVPHPSFRGLTFLFSDDNVTSGKSRIETCCSFMGITDISSLRLSGVMHTLPGLKTGHARFLQEIEGLLNKHAGLYITGNYFTGLSMEDCVGRSFREYQRFETQNR